MRLIPYIVDVAMPDKGVDYFLIMAYFFKQIAGINGLCKRIVRKFMLIVVLFIR